MWLYQFLFLVFSFQGENCIKFLVQNGPMLCVNEFNDNVRLAPMRDYPFTIMNAGTKKCNAIGHHTMHNVVYDYHINHGMIYTIDPYSGIKLNGFPLNSSLAEISSDTTLSNKYNTTKPYQATLHAFAVDWVHDTCYVTINRELFFSPVLKSDEPIPLTIIVGKPQLDQLASSGNKPVKLTNWIKLDPYEGWLFTTAKQMKSGGAKLNILRSDLKGNGLRILVTLDSYDKYFKFSIGVGEKRLYVVQEGSINVYNYEGIFLSEFGIPRNLISLDVLGDSVYVVQTNTKKRIIKMKINSNQLDMTFFVRDTKIDYLRGIENEANSIRVLDARAQRRKRDDKYLCDRKDCPDICEVWPSGDTCVCSHNKAKTIDGVSCYACGQSNLTSMVPQPTIVNGTVSKLGNFPWQASLYYTSTREYLCGGTLISSRAVLTAAHCVTLQADIGLPPLQDVTQLTVALRHTHRTWNTQDTSAIFCKVTGIRVSDKYIGASKHYANDIALLNLDSDVPVSNVLMPACLDFNLNQLPAYDAQTGYVVGFGDVEECGQNVCPKPSETLRHATTSHIMSFSQCHQEIHRRFRNMYHSLTSDKFCIGTGSGSPIQKGDSGGGFTVEHQGLHYVTGVVSVKLFRNNGSTLAYSFGACTNVSEHMDWLKRNLPR